MSLHKYQIFFRTKKGGCGITYEIAKAEVLSVFREQKVEILQELPSRMRMHVAMDLPPNEVSVRAEKLGYTYGILSMHEEPYLGEELQAHNTARWVVGWIRKRYVKIHLTEIYRQDEDRILRSAPNNRVFIIEKDGEIIAAQGQRYHRGMSPNDAKFILNITELRGDEVMIDPFAGIGGIIIECMSRGLKIFATDVDPILRLGLAQISHKRFAIADARHLPFKDDLFHTIITEPPFNTRYRQAVMDSMPELLRVVKEKIVLLIAHDMHKEITAFMRGSGFRLISDFTLRRHGKLISHVLRFDRCP